MLKDFSLKDAFIYALFLHILLMIFLGTRPQNYLDFSLFQAKKPFIEFKVPEQRPLSFRFIDVPKSVPVQEPVKKDSDLFSDRASHVEGDRIADDQTIKPKSEKPYSKGTVKDRIMSSDPGAINPPKADREEKIPAEPKTEQKSIEQQFPDGSLLVRKKEDSKTITDKKEANAPFDFLGAAQKVGDYFETENYDNSESDLGGIGLSFDVNFSQFGWYAKIIYRRVSSNFRLTIRSMLLRETGTAEIFFSIQRNGELADLKVMKTSGVEMIDDSSLNAIKLSSAFPPLPDEFPLPRLNGRFTFIVHD
ncbi:MAG: hypothetical protein A2161_21010 [Candidatus Schekmanbacteria bacterium RBG_13_48_7]|uniref:TonB C-terminal domain-containing protein n=1 Tax=Candidatus Schekmanbacteria bacterium RBG_13_48_7 TaxID=1817878 RepID=A0A1F7RRL9_9BACT|nr:MAG: hypothetical protein A2161_21010 [Candidatus Schekmanbacteria bacterium RBG_13_48_7]